MTAKPVEASLIVKKASGVPIDPDVDRMMSLDEVKRAHIERALYECEGNITHAAAMLDTMPSTLRRMIKKLRIFLPDEFRSRTRRQRMKDDRASKTIAATVRAGP